jgi:hypothetical protein
MTDLGRMSVGELVGKVLADEHADVLRQAVVWLAQEPMEAEVSELVVTPTCTTQPAHLDRATGQPVRRYEHPIPATWSTSTARSRATSPPEAATGSSAAPPGAATARPTAPGGPGRIGRRPMARSSGSTAPWSRAGPIGGCIPAKLSAGPRSDPGCTGITTTGPTAHLEVVHPSPAAPTSPSLTARAAPADLRQALQSPM